MELESIYQNVIGGNALAVQSDIQAALAAGADPTTLLQDTLIRAMGEVGICARCGERDTIGEDCDRLI